MSENEFIALCNELHGAILEINEGNIDYQNGINRTQLSIDVCVSEMIESHRIIQTENEALIELFNNIYDLSCSVRNHSYRASHLKSVLSKNIKKPDINDFDLVPMCEMFAISQKLLKNSYDKIIEATEKVLNLGKTK